MSKPRKSFYDYMSPGRKKDHEDPKKEKDVLVVIDNPSYLVNGGLRPQKKGGTFT